MSDEQLIQQMTENRNRILGGEVGTAQEAGVEEVAGEGPAQGAPPAPPTETVAKPETTDKADAKRGVSSGT